MANIKSAKKRIRQSEKRRDHNRIYKAAARTYIKKARRLIDAGNLEEAEQVVRQASAVLDKAGRRHVVHPRNAARRKGRIMAALAKARQAAAGA
jgi:small subunit ribosomal protein S20